MRRGGYAAAMSGSVKVHHPSLPAVIRQSI
jgi:hypothetical protein